MCTHVHAFSTASGLAWLVWPGALTIPLTPMHGQCKSHALHMAIMPHKINNNYWFFVCVSGARNKLKADTTAQYYTEQYTCRSWSILYIHYNYSSLRNCMIRMSPFETNFGDRVIVSPSICN